MKSKSLVQKSNLSAASSRAKESSSRAKAADDAMSKIMGGADSTNNRPVVPREAPPVESEGVEESPVVNAVCPPVGVTTAPKHTPPIIEPHLAKYLPSGDFHNMCKGRLHSAYEGTRPEAWDQMTPTDKAKWEESHSYESYLEDCIPKVDGKDARAQYEETRPETWDQMTPTDKSKWEESHPYSEWLENTVIEDMKEVALHPNEPHVGYAAGHAEEKEDHMDNDNYTGDTATSYTGDATTYEENVNNHTEAGINDSDTDKKQDSYSTASKDPRPVQAPGMPSSDYQKQVEAWEKRHEDREKEVDGHSTNPDPRPVQAPGMPSSDYQKQVEAWEKRQDKGNKTESSVESIEKDTSVGNNMAETRFNDAVSDLGIEELIEKGNDVSLDADVDISK